MEIKNAECLLQVGKVGDIFIKPLFQIMPKSCFRDVINLWSFRGVILILAYMCGSRLDDFRPSPKSPDVSFKRSHIHHSNLLAETHSWETVSVLHLLNTFRPERNFRQNKRWSLISYEKIRAALAKCGVCVCLMIYVCKAFLPSFAHFTLWIPLNHKQVWLCKLTL